MSLQIRFRDVPPSNKAKGECEELARGLEAEFPETDKFEVTVSRTGELYETHLHVTGRHVSVNASAESRELHETLVETFDKAHTQLRKHHDKQIFGRRREGQKSSPR